MLTGFSQTGIAFVLIVILLMILVSIQFTLNLILKELRELKRRAESEDWYSSDRLYRERNRKE